MPFFVYFFRHLAGLSADIAHKLQHNWCNAMENMLQPNMFALIQIFFGSSSPMTGVLLR